MTDDPITGRLVGVPFNCPHAGRRILHARDSDWPCAAPREADLPIVGEGFCPDCTRPLTAILDPTLLPTGPPIGRCPCCLGRWSIRNGELHTWAIPTGPLGVEQPTWYPAPPQGARP